MAKQITEVFQKSSSRIKSIAFHPTNPVIITGNHCGTVYIWNYVYQQIVAVLKEHTGSVRTVKIHPSGELFATAGDDKLIRIWNYKSKQVVKTLKGHTDYVRSLDFHPTKSWIVSGSDDCTLKVWDFYTGEMLSSSSGHTHYIMSVLFLDQHHILSGSLDHTLGLWKCSNLFEKKKFMVPDVVLCQSIDAHDRGVNCLHLLNNTVVSGSDDKEIKIWKYQSENLILDKAIYDHDGNVNAVFFDGEVCYGDGEDCILSSFYKGKTEKIPVSSRVWAICGKDENLAVGTDDGLIFYRKSLSMSYLSLSNEVYYSLDSKLFKYNSKQTIQICSFKSNILELLKHKDTIYVCFADSFEMVKDGRKEGSDIGSIAFIGNDSYQLKKNSILKNNTLWKSGVNGRIYAYKDSVFVVDKKSITKFVSNDEITSSFTFPIKNIRFGENFMAVIGFNKILLVDYNLNIINTINELVEIVDGFFYESMFVYTTIKQLKFFYEDTGILQSIESYSIPISISDDRLLMLNQNGIEEILLNMSEIRFRKAVLEDKDILSVIEQEQLPGLSPLEYLIQKNKGGIALPYIKDDEKRFQLFVSDRNYEEALKLCTNSKMFNQLGFESLKNENYEVAEICFKKNKDYLNIFYLYLCTKQFDKMKDLQGEEIENMAKIVTEDASIFSSIFKEPIAQLEEGIAKMSIKPTIVKNCNESKNAFTSEDVTETKPKNLMDNKTETFDSCLKSDVNGQPKIQTEKSSSGKKEKFISESKESDRMLSELDDENGSSDSFDGNLGDKNYDLTNDSVNYPVDSDEERNSSITDVVKDTISDDKNVSGSKLLDVSDEENNSSMTSSNSSRENKLHSLDIVRRDSEEVDSIPSTQKTDFATLNDSELCSQIYDMSELDLDEATKELDYNDVYTEAIELTTQGKFSKAVENFRKTISLIAVNMSSSNQLVDIRKRIGSYLVGLHVEKQRKSVTDPAKNIQMSLFFANQNLESEHIILANNLAMSTCFKLGNIDTAKKIAEAYPGCKNSKKILESDSTGNKYEIQDGYLCYDSLSIEKTTKECALCFVKSKDGDLCEACQIGILH